MECRPTQQAAVERPARGLPPAGTAGHRAPRVLAAAVRQSGTAAIPAAQPFARLAREAHDIPTHADLVADPSAGSADLRDFDYALILEAGADKDIAGFVPRCLTLLARGDFAALFKVRRDAPAC